MTILLWIIFGMLAWFVMSTFTYIVLTYCSYRLDEHYKKTTFSEFIFDYTDNAFETTTSILLPVGILFMILGLILLIRNKCKYQKIQNPFQLIARLIFRKSYIRNRMIKEV